MKILSEQDTNRLGAKANNKQNIMKMKSCTAQGVIIWANTGCRMGKNMHPIES